jgi:taurine transport system substrate-binding protein
VRMRVLAAIGLGAAILAGCGGGTGATTTTADGKTLETVVVVGSQWYGHCPAWVGRDKGIFEKAGFQIEWKVFSNSVDRVTAITSGTAQFASLGEIAMLSQMAAGNEEFYWVGNQDIAPGFEGIVAHAGIDSIADLRGKKIGLQFASSVDITARLLLAEAGLDPDTDVKLVNLKSSDIPTAFKAKNIDAGVIWEPQYSELKAVEGATVLGEDTDTEIYKKFGTMTGPDVLIISKAWTDADVDRAKRFVKAYYDSVEYVKTHLEEAADVMVPIVKQPKEKILDGLRKFVWNTAADQKRIMSDAGMYGQAEYVSRLMKEKMGKISAVPDFRKWVRTDLIPGY